MNCMQHAVDVTATWSVLTKSGSSSAMSIYIPEIFHLSINLGVTPEDKNHLRLVGLVGAVL